MAWIEAADLLAHDADIAIRIGRLPGRRYERSQPRIELPIITLWDVPADGLFPDRLVPVCALDLPPDCQGEYTPSGKTICIFIGNRSALTNR